MMGELTIKHIENCGRLYFLPKEKAALIVATTFVFVLAVVLGLFQAFMELLALLCVFLTPVISLGVLPAYRRAKFLLGGGSYKIVNGFLEVQYGNVNERFSYKGKRIKCIRRRGGVVDIVVGDEVRNFFKFFGSSERSKIVLCGVTNGSEVSEYLDLHR